MIRFQCPSCQATVSAPDDAAGKKGSCPTCDQRFIIPDAPSPQAVTSNPASPAPAPRSAPRPPRGRDEDYDLPDRKRSRRRDDDDDDDRPRSRRRDDDDDDDDDYRRRPARRYREKPGKVTAIGVMMLVGSILSILVFGVFFVTCFALVWPGAWIALSVGIRGLIQACGLLGSEPRRPPGLAVPILQILCILNGDVVNVVLGIVELIFINDPEVQSYFDN